MIDVYVLTCGEVGVDPCVPDRGISYNPVAYTGILRSPKRRIWLPVKAFLVIHPKGNILIDTGWDKNVRTHPVRTITFPMWFASKPKLPEGQAVDEQLMKHGIHVADIDYVLMTHMDIDHDSGLSMVKHAKGIYVSSGEWAAAHSLQVRYVRKPWKGIALKTMPFSKDGEAPYKKSWDLFGDGTVKVILLPGHSQGSVAVKVAYGGKFLLIVGDTGYDKDSWMKLKLPGPIYDKKMMKKSLKWVKQQSENDNCIAVLASHDSGEKTEHFEL